MLGRGLEKGTLLLLILYLLCGQPAASVAPAAQRAQQQRSLLQWNADAADGLLNVSLPGVVPSAAWNAPCQLDVGLLDVVLELPPAMGFNASAYGGNNTAAVLQPRLKDILKRAWVPSYGNVTMSLNSWVMMFQINVTDASYMPPTQNSSSQILPAAGGPMPELCNAAALEKLEAVRNACNSSSDPLDINITCSMDQVANASSGSWGACTTTPGRMYVKIWFPDICSLDSMSAVLPAIVSAVSANHSDSVCNMTMPDMHIAMHISSRYTFEVAAAVDPATATPLCQSVATQTPAALQGMVEGYMAWPSKATQAAVTSNYNCQVYLSPPSSPSSAGNRVSIVGIVVGCVCGVAALGAMVLGYQVYKRRRPDDAAAKPQGGNAAGAALPPGATMPPGPAGGQGELGSGQVHGAQLDCTLPVLGPADTRQRDIEADNLNKSYKALQMAAILGGTAGSAEPPQKYSAAAARKARLKAARNAEQAAQQNSARNAYFPQSSSSAYTWAAANVNPYANGVPANGSSSGVFGSAAAAQVQMVQMAPGYPGLQKLPYQGLQGLPALPSQGEPGGTLYTPQGSHTATGASFAMAPQPVPGMAEDQMAGQQMSAVGGVLAAQTSAAAAPVVPGLSQFPSTDGSQVMLLSNSMLSAPAPTAAAAATITKTPPAASAASAAGATQPVFKHKQMVTTAGPVWQLPSANGTSAAAAADALMSSSAGLVSGSGVKPVLDLGGPAPPPLSPRPSSGTAALPVSSAGLHRSRLLSDGGSTHALGGATMQGPMQAALLPGPGSGTIAYLPQPLPQVWDGTGSYTAPRSSYTSSMQPPSASQQGQAQQQQLAGSWGVAGHGRDSGGRSSNSADLPTSDNSGAMQGQQGSSGSGHGQGHEVGRQPAAWSGGSQAMTWSAATQGATSNWGHQAAAATGNYQVTTTSGGSNSPVSPGSMHGPVHSGGSPGHTALSRGTVPSGGTDAAGPWSSHNGTVGGQVPGYPVASEHSTGVSGRGSGQVAGHSHVPSGSGLSQGTTPLGPYASTPPSPFNAPNLDLLELMSADHPEDPGVDHARSNGPAYHAAAEQSSNSPLPAQEMAEILQMLTADSGGAFDRSAPVCAEQQPGAMPLQQNQAYVGAADLPLPVDSLQLYAAGSQEFDEIINMLDSGDVVPEKPPAMRAQGTDGMMAPGVGSQNYVGRGLATGMDLGCLPAAHDHAAHARALHYGMPMQQQYGMGEAPPQDTREPSSVVDAHWQLFQDWATEDNRAQPAGVQQRSHGGFTDPGSAAAWQLLQQHAGMQMTPEQLQQQQQQQAFEAQQQYMAVPQQARRQQQHQQQRQRQRPPAATINAGVNKKQAAAQTQFRNQSINSLDQFHDVWPQHKQGAQPPQLTLQQTGMQQWDLFQQQ